MAAFCTKCGAPLASATGFCSSCGTPIATAPAAPVQAAPPAAPYGQPVPPPAAGYPMAAQPQSSGSALKIILIIIAVVVGIGILGACTMGFMAWRVAKSIHVNNNGNGATVSVPGVGTISAGDSTATAAELGVPVYPGATQKKGGVNMDTPQATMVSAQFSTNDPMSAVVDFYKGKLGDSAVAVSTGDGTVLNSGGSDADRIMITIGPSSGDDTGKTTFLIMHTRKKQS